MCFPHFDSPTLFAAMLDDDKGGRFKIAPRAADRVRHKQRPPTHGSYTTSRDVTWCIRASPSGHLRVDFRDR
jgi:hypothetical protein